MALQLSHLKCTNLYSSQVVMACYKNAAINVRISSLYKEVERYVQNHKKNLEMGNKGGMESSTALLFTTSALLVVIVSLSFPLLADAELDSKPSHHGVYKPKTPPPPKKKPVYVSYPPLKKPNASKTPPRKPSPPPHKPYYMPPKSPKKPPVKHMPPPPYAPEDVPFTLDTPAPVSYKVFKSPPIVVTIPGHPKSPPKGKSPPPPKMKKLFPPPPKKKFPFPPKKKFPPPLY
ncbi:extensin-3-like [Papaver somniferum]|uniref:extensin-3-like n=1 Tax=Papaver somniferum TaxID=3469 RepID=UPI000E6FD131|nr:extensin-3-like [Papaver somniferum]